MRWQPVLIALLLIACGDDETITVYELEKSDPHGYGHEWLPLHPTTYRVGNDKVISETAGMLSEFGDCIIMTTENWECRYDDGSGVFGFRKGEYWENDPWPDRRVVSRFYYNRVRCHWAISDPYDGPFWGALRCVFGWR